MGWEDRLFHVLVHGTNKTKVTGYCLEAHDLAVAKYVAGREKDYGFLAVMINKGMLRKKELISRIYKTIGINHQLIIEKVKRDFKDYASSHIDFKKMFDVSKPSIPSAAIRDEEKKAFINKIKQRIGRK